MQNNSQIIQNIVTTAVGTTEKDRLLNPAFVSLLNISLLQYKRTDWELLREQKKVLIEFGDLDPKQEEALSGILSFLDNFQDHAQKLGFPAYEN